MPSTTTATMPNVATLASAKSAAAAPAASSDLRIAPASGTHQSKLPTSKSSYIVPSCSGEHLYVPSSNSIYRIQAGAEQTQTAFAIVETDGSVCEPVLPHLHKAAHDVFYCLRGQVNVWAGGQGRLLSAGDFASVPPGTVHSYAQLAARSQHLGLIFPGDWAEFFRVLGDSTGDKPMAFFPSGDTAAFPRERISKLLAEGHDMIPQPQHKLATPVPTTVEQDTTLPQGTEPFYLKADSGPRYILGGTMAQPLCLARNSNGRFSALTLEASSLLPLSPLGSASNGIKFAKTFTFFKVLDGFLSLSVLKSDGQIHYDTLQHFESGLVAPGEAFRFNLDQSSPDLRLIIFSGTAGDQGAHKGGIEELYIAAGQQVERTIYPGGNIERKVQVIEQNVAKWAAEFDAEIVEF